MKKNLTILMFLLFSVSFIKAQDKMILRGKPDTLSIKVLEIGTDEIKYKLWPVDESLPIMVVEKERVSKLILQNGSIMKFSESDFTDPNFYINQKKMAVKVDMFSILQGTLSLGFEKSIAPGRSWEAGLGIIGVTDATPNNGFFVRGGLKFINTPDFQLKGMRYMHIMKGSYVKPELAMSLYDNSFKSYNYLTSTTYELTEQKDRRTSFALILNFGKQWIFADRFLVDAFVGGGLGGYDESTISKTTTTLTGNIYYSYDYNSEGQSPMGTGFFMGGNNNGVGLAWQAGLKVGFLIGSNKNNN
jgi:hypothetical protein